MDEMIMVFWTCAGLDDARQIARFLVTQRLVACANITPWVESIYLWDEQIDTAQESQVVCKTRKSLFPAVKQAILERIKYEVPEILAVEIHDGHQEYLEWVTSSTTPLPCESAGKRLK